MITINNKNLCENCFMETTVSPCPFCGYEKSTDNRDGSALIMGTILDNRYTIGGVIGRGGFGITYLAYDNKLEKRVAIKEYYPKGITSRKNNGTTVSVTDSGDQQTFHDGAERFYNEAELVAQFNGNPNIVNVYDFFRENDTVYFTMGYLQGETLKSYIGRKGRITEGQAMNVLAKVTNALLITHSMNILHRDISPDNIMLCDDGTIKLLDFGAAKQVIAEESHSLSVILKQGFAPLEQYQKRGKQGPWTDIYALGATIYTALTGKHLDDPMTRMEDDTAFENDIYGISEDLWQIIKKCTMLKADNRYQEVSELKKDLVSLKIFEEPFGDILLSDDIGVREQVSTETELLNGVSYYSPATVLDPISHPHIVEKALKPVKTPPPINTTAAEDLSFNKNEILFERGNIALKNKEWEKAQSFFDKVLNNDPRNAEAYTYLLLTEKKCQSLEELSKTSEPIKGCPNFKNAVEFGDSELKSALKRLSDIIDRKNEMAKRKKKKRISMLLIIATLFIVTFFTLTLVIMWNNRDVEQPDSIEAAKNQENIEHNIDDQEQKPNTDKDDLNYDIDESDPIYIEGMELLNNKDFMGAGLKFRELSDNVPYKEDLLKMVNYEWAKTSSGSTAIERFELAGDYKDAKELKLQEMYDFVCSYPPNGHIDTQTNEYFNELISNEYKDSKTIYQELLEWKFISSSVSDKAFDMNNHDVVSKSGPYYINYLIGGGPLGGGSFKVVTEYSDGTTYTDTLYVDIDIHYQDDKLCRAYISKHWVNYKDAPDVTVTVRLYDPKGNLVSTNKFLWK